MCVCGGGGGGGGGGGEGHIHIHLCNFGKGRKKIVYLTSHSTHFIWRQAYGKGPLR